jgi:hypothetical protein
MDTPGTWAPPCRQGQSSRVGAAPASAAINRRSTAEARAIPVPYGPLDVEHPSRLGPAAPAHDATVAAAYST